MTDKTKDQAAYVSTPAGRLITAYLVEPSKEGKFKADIVIGAADHDAFLADLKRAAIPLLAKEFSKPQAEIAKHLDEGRFRLPLQSGAEYNAGREVSMLAPVEEYADAYRFTAWTKFPLLGDGGVSRLFAAEGGSYVPLNKDGAKLTLYRGCYVKLSVRLASYKAIKPGEKSGITARLGAVAKVRDGQPLKGGATFDPNRVFGAAPADQYDDEIPF